MPTIEEIKKALSEPEPGIEIVEEIESKINAYRVKEDRLNTQKFVSNLVVCAFESDTKEKFARCLVDRHEDLLSDDEAFALISDKLKMVTELASELEARRKEEAELREKRISELTDKLIGAIS
jgi:hypothetical protein